MEGRGRSQGGQSAVFLHSPPVLIPVPHGDGTIWDHFCSFSPRTFKPSPSLAEDGVVPTTSSQDAMGRGVCQAAIPPFFPLSSHTMPGTGSSRFCSGSALPWQPTHKVPSMAAPPPGLFTFRPTRGIVPIVCNISWKNESWAFCLPSAGKLCHISSSSARPPPRAAAPRIPAGPSAGLAPLELVHGAASLASGNLGSGLGAAPRLPKAGWGIDKLSERHPKEDTVPGGLFSIRLRHLSPIFLLVSLGRVPAQRGGVPGGDGFWAMPVHLRQRHRYVPLCSVGQGWGHRRAAAPASGTLFRSRTSVHRGPGRGSRFCRSRQNGRGRSGLREGGFALLQGPELQRQAQLPCPGSGSAAQHCALSAVL